MYEHVLDSDLEWRSTASVDLVDAMLLEGNGMEAGGWRIGVVVGQGWVRRISLWVMKGPMSRLADVSELWNGDVQKVILVPAAECMRFIILMIVNRLCTFRVRWFMSFISTPR